MLFYIPSPPSKHQKNKNINDRVKNIFVIKIDPIVIPYSGYNFGLACLYSDNNNTWYKGSFYVDVVRCDWFPPNEAIQMKKHILREELTQSIGLLNDSMKYPNSIFYHGWTFPTEYTELDKEVIKMHYNR